VGGGYAGDGAVGGGAVALGDVTCVLGDVRGESGIGEDYLSDEMGYGVAEKLDMKRKRDGWVLAVRIDIREDKEQMKESHRRHV
jgi:hypothetical protein